MHPATLRIVLRASSNCLSNLLSRLDNYGRVRPLLSSCYHGLTSYAHHYDRTPSIRQSSTSAPKNLTTPDHQSSTDAAVASVLPPRYGTRLASSRPLLSVLAPRNARTQAGRPGSSTFGDLDLEQSQSALASQLHVARNLVEFVDLQMSKALFLLLLTLGARSRSAAPPSSSSPLRARRIFDDETPSRLPAPTSTNRSQIYTDAHPWLPTVANMGIRPWFDGAPARATLGEVGMISFTPSWRSESSAGQMPEGLMQLRRLILSPRSATSASRCKQDRQRLAAIEHRQIK
ncbi:hypothetical protein CPLU01_04453 [Colletotrichum plurivorum]|uniref:Uncharacterized protein n=1 Tax=Colletotrichum plurivorum TaxID=2175906 RepID=A0A8H6KQE3_9PEZI|nr:hypothetical protein CPLU01_04453 [Colletotrichum plurivorum]